MKPQPNHLIMSTSATLIGICFFVISNLIRLDSLDRTYIDDFSILAITCFFVSCTSAYLAMRTRNEKKSRKIERIADTFFLTGLSVLSVSALLFALKLIK